MEGTEQGKQRLIGIGPVIVVYAVRELLKLPGLLQLEGKRIRLTGLTLEAEDLDLRILTESLPLKANPFFGGLDRLVVLVSQPGEFYAVLLARENEAVVEPAKRSGKWLVGILAGDEVGASLGREAHRAKRPLILRGLVLAAELFQGIPEGTPWTPDGREVTEDLLPLLLRLPHFLSGFSRQVRPIEHVVEEHAEASAEDPNTSSHTKATPWTDVCIWHPGIPDIPKPFGCVEIGRAHV